VAVDGDLAWLVASVAQQGGEGAGSGAGAPTPAIGAAPAQLLLEGGSGPGAPPPTTSTALATVDPAALRAGKRRLAAAFDDLQDCYLSLRREREMASGGRGGGGGSGDGALVPTTATASAPAADSAALVPHSTAAAAADASDQQGRQSSPATAGPGPALAEVSRLLSVCVRAGGRLAHRALLPSAGAPVTAAVGDGGSGTSAPPAAGSSIISSVEFDAGAAHFATAGVAKRIGVWRFDDVVAAAASGGDGSGDDGDSPRRRVRSGSAASPSPPPPPPLTPAVSLAAAAKLSCVSWCRAPGGPAHLLASADYGGGVTLWDAAVGRAVATYDAHDRRAWSVDFCPVGGGNGAGVSGATTFATASDDGTARVWCTRSRSPIATLAVGANVCCARFAPAGVPGAAAATGAELALGSADHAVRVYDLRSAGRGPLATLAGHAQAVSYVRYAPGAPGLVSASTDATLRLWNRGWASAGENPPSQPQPRCVRVYRGHANERNFVGLDAAGDLVAAGSEAGEVVVYAAALSRPIARAACDGGGVGGLGTAARPAVSAGGLPAPPAFVSAVCWRPAAGDEGCGPARLPRTLLAATSRGSVHVLELGE
jgi:hypothetical protein